MPRESHALPFDEGPLCPLGVVLECFHDLPLPSHVGPLGQILPIVRAWLADKTSMLGAQSQLGYMTHPLVEEGLVSSTDDPNGVARIRRQRFDGP